jgi:hypothetical protein
MPWVGFAGSLLCALCRAGFPPGTVICSVVVVGFFFLLEFFSCMDRSDLKSLAWCNCDLRPGEMIMKFRVPYVLA